MEEAKSKEQIEMEKAAEELERKIVRFTNIDNESFTHSFRGISTTVKSGASIVMRFPEADHLATHLARKILSRAKKETMTALERQKGTQLWTESGVNDLKEKILSEVAQEQSAKTTIEQAHKEDIENLQTKYEKPEQPKEVNITKKDVIKELESRGITVDSSKTKEELLSQLMELEAQGK